MKIKKGLFLMIGLLAVVVSQGLFGFARTAEADRDVEQTVVIHNLTYDKLPSEIQNTGDEMTDFSGEPLAGSIFTAYDVTSVYWDAYDAASGEHLAKETAAIKAAVFLSNDKGVVKAEGLVLSPGIYEFYEIESDVATSEKQDTNPDNNYKYHFLINPKVSFTVSDEWKVTRYNYYDQKLQPKELNAPFGDNLAEAYNFKVPNVKKEVDDSDVRNGQELTYTISKKIPEDVGNYSMYKLIDTFDKRLELCCNEEKIIKSIKINDGEPTGLSPKFSMGPGTNEFCLTFTPANLAQHATKTLSFSATMKVKAGTDLKDIDNDVLFENSFRDSKDEERVQTYGKRFVKVDSRTDKKLEGVEFAIKNKNGEFMNLAQESDGKFVESVTGCAQDYVVNWVTAEKDVTKLISDKAGNFGIYGLGSNGENYYTLVETKAPDGYVKLKEMKFTADGAADAQILRVENKTKGILPMTGGWGITGLVVIGIFGLASGVTYFKKRNRLTGK